MYGTLTGHILRLTDGRVLWTSNVSGLYPAVRLTDEKVYLGCSQIAKVESHTWEHNAYLIAWVNPVDPTRIVSFGLRNSRFPKDYPNLLAFLVAEAGAPSFEEAKVSLLAQLAPAYKTIKNLLR
jgi:hypothetical protein